YPGQKPLSLLPFSFELFLYILLFLRLHFFMKEKYAEAARPFLFFILFFTGTVFLFIGYTVPNLGALVRYRSLYFPLLLTPLLCRINWKRIRISI
ncbi:MAG TPA: hypothetical protein VHL77_02460, partial [Ferruginibacter sp.]|nr:hypothetical protein [Ferruginibacter sp.]